MHEITAKNAVEFLISAGHLGIGEPAVVCELPGGVSNVVLSVLLPQRDESFILKQARGRLRVSEEWLCSVERIWREVDVLRTCARLMNTGGGDGGPRNEAVAADSIVAYRATVPTVLWEDRENFLYAMTAAPDGHATWKQQLLNGQLSGGNAVAMACGRFLGQLHSRSWSNTAIATRLEDRTYFNQLRLDPYYRHVARAHAELQPSIESLIDSVWQHRCSLVHGDFSPKNLLVWPGQVMLIDFEVGHYGDPAFDLGFFLTHLVLKSIQSGPRQGEYLQIATSFWHSYGSTVGQQVTAEELSDLERRAMWNLAGCMLARVDGKSPVEYLTVAQQKVIRGLSRQWLQLPPIEWSEVVSELLSAS